MEIKPRMLLVWTPESSVRRKDSWEPSIGLGVLGVSKYLLKTAVFHVELVRSLLWRLGEQSMD